MIHCSRSLLISSRSHLVSDRLASSRWVIPRFVFLRCGGSATPRVPSSRSWTVTATPYWIFNFTEFIYSLGLRLVYICLFRVLAVCSRLVPARFLLWCRSDSVSCLHSALIRLFSTRFGFRIETSASRSSRSPWRRRRASSFGCASSLFMSSAHFVFCVRIIFVFLAVSLVLRALRGPANSFVFVSSARCVLRAHRFV